MALHWPPAPSWPGLICSFCQVNKPRLQEQQG
ncbi:MAG: hypothetical protein ACOY15_05805 [Pseudomonadota bacterium]